MSRAATASSATTAHTIHTIHYAILYALLHDIRQLLRFIINKGIMDKISNWKPHRVHHHHAPRLLEHCCCRHKHVICRKYGVPWTWTLILQPDRPGGMLVIGGIRYSLVHRLRFYIFIWLVTSPICWLIGNKVFNEHVDIKLWTIPDNDKKWLKQCKERMKKSWWLKSFSLLIFLFRLLTLLANMYVHAKKS